jgi:hypothetical protein
MPPGAWMPHLIVVSCNVEVDVSESCRSLVKGRPTECGVSECDRKAAISF